MSVVKIKFDSNQVHQNQAVESIINLFDGLPHSDHLIDFTSGEDSIPNLPHYQSLEHTWLLDNLNNVQRTNGINESLDLDYNSGFMVEGVSTDTWQYPVCTIEMETGTGKTYVYLKTIYQLKKDYGFRKFIIIVPSIAIYEGVINTFKITEGHFNSHFGNETVHLLEYDGSKPGIVRNFSTSTTVDILLMTIDSFNKKSNNLYKRTDKIMGEKYPFQYIQDTRPILILDESQNYQSPKSQASLRTLKPLFAINFSATPVSRPNLLYHLSPVDAFRLNLVKRIEVLGLVEAQATAKRDDYLKVESITGKGKSIKAEIRLNVMKKSALVEEVIEVKDSDNLFTKTKNECYKGYIIREINLSEQFIEFKNDIRIYLNDERYASITKEALFRHQIEETIKIHFEKQRELLPLGIKVLSLFFIDRVANYVEDEGIIKILFNESFNKLKKKDDYFKKYSADDVQSGYFAKKKATRTTKETYIDTALESSEKTADDIAAEKEAYLLIMKNKERLLSLDENVSFIFAHSALREGWDNPNVFQICALREISSEKERRQTIGRGLRLPVNQSGDRSMDRSINTLTVIANESYQSYVANLQQEYEATGDVLPHVPSNASDPGKAKRQAVYSTLDFKNFWNKLIRKTEYSINIDTDKIIQESLVRLNNLALEKFPKPHLVITRGEYVITDYRIDLLTATEKEVKLRISKKDTNNNSDENIRTFKKGDHLSVSLKDATLSGFKITNIVYKGTQSEVHFSEAGILMLDSPIIFSSECGQSVSSSQASETITGLPKFNLIDRASKELSLTRATIFEIFKNLSANRKQCFIDNPEGFASVFITMIRNVLADHIADTIEYTLTEELIPEPESGFFPEVKKFPAKELTPGSKVSLYDLIQYDSDNEKQFITQLNSDGKVILYFKFPATFKINMPKIIQNYNPDWGILRFDQNDRIKLELVRETKGNIDPNLLQFPGEIRKIKCAQKHFSKVGVSYRQIKGDTQAWWEEPVGNVATLPYK